MQKAYNTFHIPINTSSKLIINAHIITQQWKIITEQWNGIMMSQWSLEYYHIRSDYNIA